MVVVVVVVVAGTISNASSKHKALASMFIYIGFFGV